ncbi:MAG: DUF4091 domain-containing protein [Chloroflexi bacterium]|nr:DUF4091 domain-containing protein [Chloroflexota bacterium]
MSTRSWLLTSSVRCFPSTLPQATSCLELRGALNEQFSFQVAVRSQSDGLQRVSARVDAPSGWAVRVRRVGYVPVRHHNLPIAADAVDVEGLGCIPGYIPDPLFDEDEFVLPPGESHAFWVTLRPGNDASPGWHQVSVEIATDSGSSQKHDVAVHLHRAWLEKRREFSITHWFYCDALIDWYQTDLFDERFWDILPKYVDDVVAHGLDTLYVPIFTPPLDGVKRPSQLLRVAREGPDAYVFDWSDVRRYVNLAREAGMRNFEWCHLFTQWGVEHAIRIYEGQGRDERLLWTPETGATSDTYRTFLSQFLPALYEFLRVEDLLQCSYFHVSDEPHGEAHLANYRQARALLKELAPWMRVMDALTEISFAQQGLTDMPIPSIKTATDFVAAGIPSWCYYCCGPRGAYLNRLLDTPLAKIAMHGLLFYRWPFRGFLHWGYNYWYESQTRRLIDPFTVQDGLAWERGWAYGDPFMVYPGPEGPVDSLRWEVFGESLQDYALLQTLGVDRDDPLLSSVRSFEDFPKTSEWRENLRFQILKRVEG